MTEKSINDHTILSGEPDEAYRLIFNYLSLNFLYCKVISVLIKITNEP